MKRRPDLPFDSCLQSQPVIARVVFVYPACRNPLYWDSIFSSRTLSTFSVPSASFASLSSFASTFFNSSSLIITLSLTVSLPFQTKLSLSIIRQRTLFSSILTRILYSFCKLPPTTKSARFNLLYNCNVLCLRLHLFIPFSSLNWLMSANL